MSHWMTASNRSTSRWSEYRGGSASGSGSRCGSGSGSGSSLFHSSQPSNLDAFDEMNTLTKVSQFGSGSTAARRRQLPPIPIPVPVQIQIRSRPENRNRNYSTSPPDMHLRSLSSSPSSSRRSSSEKPVEVEVPMDEFERYKAASYHGGIFPDEYDYDEDDDGYDEDDEEELAALGAKLSGQSETSDTNVEDTTTTPHKHSSIQQYIDFLTGRRRSSGSGSTSVSVSASGSGSDSAYYSYKNSPPRSRANRGEELHF